MKSNFLHRPVLHLALISALGLMVYSNTFDVPFQFDDYVVMERPVRDLSDIPSLFAGGDGLWASRPLLHATIALNYHFGGMDTTGYHAVNLALHILNAMLLYLLIVMTGKRLGHSEGGARLAGLFASLLFTVHPVQTEGVTYIASRSMLFATAFYLAGIILFAKAVTAERRRGFYIAGLFAVSLLGAASREDSLTFPVVLFLYDLFFISRFRLFNRKISLQPLVTPPSPLKLRGARGVMPFSTNDVVDETVAGHWKAYLPTVFGTAYLAYLVIYNTYVKASGLGDTTPLQYVLTQFNVHATYLRLLVLPVNQDLDYNYPISKALLEFPTALSFLGYAGLWAAALLLARKKRLMAFPIFWFLITLVPISIGVAAMDLRLGDVIFEHRLYLPSAGLFAAAGAGAAVAVSRLDGKPRAGAVAVLTLLPLVLAGAAYARNALWKTDVTIWEDVVSKSPGKARAYNNLADAYLSQGQPDKAIVLLKKALTAEQYNAEIYLHHYGLARAYETKGLIEEAIEQYQFAINFKPNYADAHNNIGNAYLKKGRLDRAVEHLQIAVGLTPDFAEGHYNLGIAYKAIGQPEKAIERFRIALSLKPDFADAHNNLGVIYKSEGLLDEAIGHFQAAAGLAPDNAGAYNNLGNAYRAKGMFGEAIEHLRTAVRLKPDYAEAHNNLGVAYISTGRLDEAIENFKAAARLNPDSADVRFNLGLAYLEKGLKIEARGEFEAALRIDPGHPGARRQLKADE